MTTTDDYPHPLVAEAEHALAAAQAAGGHLSPDLQLDLAAARAELTDVFPPYPLSAERPELHSPPPRDLRTALATAATVLEAHELVCTDIGLTLRSASVGRKVDQILADLDQAIR